MTRALVVVLTCWLAGAAQAQYSWSKPYEEARKAFADGEFERAHLALIGVVRQADGHFQPTQMLAIVALELEQLQQAAQMANASLANLNRFKKHIPAGHWRLAAAENYRILAEVRLRLGDYEGARQQLLRSMQTNRGHMMSLLMSSKLLLSLGDAAAARRINQTWLASVRRMDPAAKQTQTAMRTWRMWEVYLIEAESLRMTGDPGGARRILSEMSTRLRTFPNAMIDQTSHLLAHSAIPAPRAAAAAGLARIGSLARKVDPRLDYGLGMLLASAGRHADAVARLERFPARAVWPEARYQLGRSLLEIEQVDRAREQLIPLARVNAKIKQRLIDAGLWKLLIEGGQLERLAERVKLPAEEQAARLAEQELIEQLLAQVDSEVRRYRFARAIEDLKRVEQRFKGPGDVKAPAQIRERRQQIERYRELFERVRTKAAAGAFAEHVLELSGVNQGRIVGADKRALHLEFKGGKGKLNWVFLGYDDYLALATQVAANAEERLELARFLLDVEASKPALALLTELRGKHAELADRIDALYSRQTGTPVPPGGFVVYRGKLYDPETAAALRKGLVRWGDQWVTKEDRSHLKQGHEKVNGKWTRLTAKQLEARGYKRHDGDWIKVEQLEKIKGEWKEAWVKASPRWRVRTNTSEQTAEELLALCDALSKELERFFGFAPKEQLTLYAFKGFEDYKAYCLKLNKEQVLGALGFAPSEPKTACGYDRFKQRQIFYGTMVHEATHLFWWEGCKAKVPSWLAEGMATYFEGWRAQDGTYAFGKLNKNRLRLLKKALGDGDLFTSEKLVGGSALQLLNVDNTRALIFYAQCWGTFYYLINSRHRQAFKAFLAKAAKGQKPDLFESLGLTPAQLDKELRPFWKGL